MHRIAFAIVCLIVLTACDKPTTSPTVSDRGELSVASLMSDATPAGPVQNHWFMPPEKALPALQDFSGIIRIPEHLMMASVTPIDAGEFSIIEEKFKYPAPEGSDQIVPGEIAGKATQLFPGLEVAFVTYSERLLPVERSLMATAASESFWHVQIAPGRVWSEPGDGGKSRASFPFMMTNNIETSHTTDSPHLFMTLKAYPDFVTRLFSS